MVANNRAKMNQFLINQIFLPLPLTYKKSSVIFRNKMNPWLMGEFAKSLPRKARIIKNDYENNGKPTIYAATHVFYDDIVAILCAISENMYLVADNDVKHDIKPYDALGLYFNGVMFFEKDSKVAKKNAREVLTDRMVKVLNHGGNILIFPESTWNFSPNRLIREELPWGLLKVADLTNANVVPVAIDLIDDDYVLKVGKKLDRTNCHATDIRLLRDEMATLVWDLIEQKAPLKREEIGLGFDNKYCYNYIEDKLIPNEEYWYNYIQEKCQGDAIFDFVKEDECAYKPKSKISLDEIIAEMHNIDYRTMASDYEKYIRIRSLSDGFARINH